MITEIDTSWRHWIDTNIRRGCNAEELYRILVRNNFCPQLAARTLNYWPVNPSQQSVAVAAEFLTPTSEEIQAAQINLRAARKIDTDGRLQLYCIDNFLPAGECAALVDLVRPKLRPSTTTNKRDQYRGYRTSSTCDLGLVQDPLATDLDTRICRVLGINPTYSESIQAQWYREGQQFKPHTDYFEPGSEEYRRFAGQRGQRTWTFMIYLNEDCEGGETRFTRLDKAFSPKRGSAVIWNSLKEDGRPNPDSVHCGMPVARGEKVIITKWFRARGQGSQLIRGSGADKLW